MSGTKRYGDNYKEDMSDSLSDVPEDNQTRCCLERSNVNALNTLSTSTSPTSADENPEIQTTTITLQKILRITSAWEATSDMDKTKIIDQQRMHDEGYDSELSSRSPTTEKSIPPTSPEDSSDMYRVSSPPQNTSRQHLADLFSKLQNLEVTVAEAEGRIAACKGDLHPVHDALKAVGVESDHLRNLVVNMAGSRDFMQPYMDQRPDTPPPPPTSAKGTKANIIDAKYCRVGRPNPKRLRLPHDDLQNLLCSKHRYRSEFTMWMDIHGESADAWKCA
ncbi:hypothetical protein T440DRAFT_520240 [Plenodomus tracheiphilus IPT5]|uniref:Uncharacterized protein n=1 Tax=Plenodomus tracheiphilus IPT5 TaxID=1408161 RepID=A0A6A7AYV0_9PLEO|nr:hypothetical protein T440DRAFT_520240 [Plenodomus tracheiphilus IPT5]